MPTRFIQRRSALGPNDRSLARANAIYVDSDNNIVTYTTGSDGTTEEQVVGRTLTQTLTNKTLTSPTVTGPITTGEIYDITTATLAIAAATHAGRIGTMNRAAGIAVTLPAATGTGNRYRFIVGTTATGNHDVIVTGNDAFFGNALLAQDAADTAVMFEAGTDADTIRMNGTTTGGLKGAYVEVVDIATDTWFVWLQSAATGTEATPFLTGQVT